MKKRANYQRNLVTICEAEMNSEYVKVILDSISPVGRRITTLEVRYWRMIHSELMTHCSFARNAASSRAIPVTKTFEMIENDPFIPEFIGCEKKGMQSGEQLCDGDLAYARGLILDMRNYCLDHCKQLAEIGVHKSIINRYLEPWSYITVLITATNWRNFFALRVHEAAEKHFNKVAIMMQDAMIDSKPVCRVYHMPYVVDGCSDNDEYDAQTGMKVSTGRCARLSYLTHDGKRDWKKDVELYDKLMLNDPKHASPASHPATALADPNQRCAQYLGWQPYRMTIKGESVQEPIL